MFMAAEGVGKTFLARSWALLRGRDIAYIVVNYHNEHAALRDLER